jgi:hypothetical protein
VVNKIVFPPWKMSIISVKVLLGNLHTGCKYKLINISRYIKIYLVYLCTSPDVGRSLYKYVVLNEKYRTRKRKGKALKINSCEGSYYDIKSINSFKNIQEPPMGIMLFLCLYNLSSSPGENILWG